MWTRIFLRATTAALAALAAVSSGGPIAFSPAAIAQEAGKSPGPSSTANVWNQVQWLRLEVNGGRIALTSRRCGQTRLTIEPTEASPWRQSLAVEAQPGALVASYDATTDEQAITLSVDGREQVIVTRRGSSGGNAELKYVQPPLGPVSLTLGADEPRKYTAASLWHLLVAEPAAREELLPALSTIRPNWGLADQLAAAEGALLAAAAGTDAGNVGNRNAGDGSVAPRRQWQSWVDQLADPSFARRNEADQSLRAAGQAVVVHLRQLDPSALDREQRQRIGGILTTISGSGADSPERVAGWLADCKRVWLALLSRPDPLVRAAAAGHLSRLSGKPIAIDTSASNERQAQQLLELKALLSEH